MKAGLLPLYIELYDRAMPEARPQAEQFVSVIAAELRARGVEVMSAPVCRLRPEFEQAIADFESADVDAVVTLHLAYSPSLESSQALADTRLPIVVLDTTPAFSYGPTQDPAELMFNHGIHGVQDMCNLLLRNGKDYAVVAGHWQHSKVLDDAVEEIRVASMARSMRESRVGIIGQSFQGMGDFAIEPDELAATVGVEVVASDAAALSRFAQQVTDEAVRDELEADAQRFNMAGLDPLVYERSARAGLAVRRWIDEEKLSAFTMNFLDVSPEIGLATVPFLEASKALSRGIGYAGEGDTLTAALVGVLASRYPATFTEMFCPDWEGNSIFLSHMGEMNIDLAAGRPALKESEFPWTDASNPVIAVGRFRHGPATLVNVAPWGEGSYALIIAPVEMLDVTGEDRMAGSVHGWFRPESRLADFLRCYSEAGGTHHCALVYGELTSLLGRFGRAMRWQVIVLDAETIQ